jgi:TetR/AcrR family acrAB operon transcriptional repressor/TetR/AcrR family transcriptional repressor of mexAB-oprM operon
MPRRTKDEAEQTRNAILDAAERVFNQRGVARTSLEEIARAASVTRGAVYWHFRDKTALCEAMLQRVFLPQEDILDRLATSESDTPLTDLKKACSDCLSLMSRDKRRRRVATILNHRCEYVEEMTAIMKRRWQSKDRMLSRSKILFERAKKLGQLAPGWTPQLAARTLQALMSGIIGNALEREKNFSLATEGVACVEAFFRSIHA